MSRIEVLKFGSSVLRTPEDLPVAVDEIYRHWRCGCRVLAVVSAFEGVTDRLFKEADTLFGSSALPTAAAFVATGEQRTATLLVSALIRSGIPARLVEPHEIGLLAEGSSLESTPVRVDVDALERFWRGSPILVLPGFYGVDWRGRTALFGRGGSDLSALFLAAELQSGCRLLKDVNGVFDADPASSTVAHRFTTLSWAMARRVAGPLIQEKALRYAEMRALPFQVGRANERACTLVGEARDQWAARCATVRPLRVVLLGCGVVGRGVYESLRRYPQIFELYHVVVRDGAKHPDIRNATTDAGVVLDDSIDIVVDALGGIGLPYRLVMAALAAGKFVVTANQALVAAHWAELSVYARGLNPQLWFSAAVGGALPVLEILQALGTRGSPVREIRGCVAEADPARDLSGRDSADKLALMIYAAFREWIAPDTIPTRGIDSLTHRTTGYKLIARATRHLGLVTASVAPELLGLESYLGQARGAENRVEIELNTGQVIKLSGQGAGRWPTAVSVVGDLFEVARLAETDRSLPVAAPSLAAQG